VDPSYKVDAPASTSMHLPQHTSRRVEVWITYCRKHVISVCVNTQMACSTASLWL